MDNCEICGEETSMPYKCNLCEKKFCSDHRLPENHNCKMLKRGAYDKNKVIKSTRQDSKESYIPKIDKLNSTPKLWDKIDGNVTKIFGLTFLAIYILQLLTLFLFGQSTHNALFVLKSENPYHVWTWITSIFSHSPWSPFHIIGNGIILIFFGSLLEKVIGSKKYLYLFIISGILSGLSQIILSNIFGEITLGILGASGALLAVMGVLTVYKPDLTVYLFFLLPVPIWTIMGGFSILSILLIVFQGSTFGGISHIAHITGILIGVVYGQLTKEKHSLNQLPQSIT